MAWRPQRILDDATVEAGIASAGSVKAYAALMSVSPGTVKAALSRIRSSRGEKRTADCDWESRLRKKPTRAQIDRLAASHGADACREMWGALPKDLRKRATARV